MTDSFDIPRILAQTLVRRVDYHAVLPSTNDAALQQLRSGEAVELPLLVLAACQTHGRGRGDRAWWSADGALTFSLVLALDPQQLPVARRAWLGLAAGVAVADAIGQLLPATAPGLKWPNDVYLAGRKVCGILVESPGRAAGGAVVGVGMNVNNSFAAAPAELRHRATSLADATGQRLDVSDVLICVLQHLGDTPQLLVQRPEWIIGRWRERCLLTGRQVGLRVGTRSVHGRCLGIDDHGRLLLDTGTATDAFTSGTVEEIGRTSAP